MWFSTGVIRGGSHAAATAVAVFADVGRFLTLCARSRSALAAENLFLRKQLALYEERKVRPHLATDAFRFVMCALGRLFEWPSALRVVKPDTFTRWHRKGFRLFWRWKSRPKGRPTLPRNLRELIRRMAADNPVWGEERIADELLLKLGLRVSPRTVGKYLSRASSPPRTPDPKQRWATFVRNHAKGVVACDFFVVVTATFRVLYVFVLMEVGTRRIVHCNVTAHPTADWTLQQFREALPGDHAYRYVIHDRDRIFSKEMDKMVEALGVKVLRTPVRAPKANGFCERIVRTVRRECLDFLIPFSESHLRRILREWVEHYNHGRPHKCLGPGIPQPLVPIPAPSFDRHVIPTGLRVRARPVLGGLHHEYSLEKHAA
jgi:putative transposase